MALKKNQLGDMVGEQQMKVEQKRMIEEEKMMTKKQQRVELEDW